MSALIVYCGARFDYPHRVLLLVIDASFEFEPRLL